MSHGWLVQCAGRDRVQNPGMQRFVPVPSDLQPWLMAGVVVDAPAELAQSHFPAMVSSMLVVRLAGQVHCRGALVPPAAWISASTTATVYEHGGPVRAVGLVLQPEAAAALFASARGLVNTLRPLVELVGPGWTEVEHGVHAAQDDGARITVLCQFVRQLVAPPSPCEARRLQALALLQAAHDDALGANQHMGLSQRQFERRFVAHWGMAPKQFQVIARLNSTLGNALATPGGTVVDLAADQGYYDQSHMARDVRRLAGHPLQALVQGTRSPLTAHWPLQIGAQTLPESTCPTRGAHAQALSQVQRHHKREANAKAGRDVSPAPRAQAAVCRHPGGERHGGQVHVAGDAGGQCIGKGIAPENIGHHAATRQKIHGVEVPRHGQTQKGQQKKKCAQAGVVLHRCMRPSKEKERGLG